MKTGRFILYLSNNQQDKNIDVKHKRLQKRIQEFVSAKNNTNDC
jgi:hypothetical protein